MLHYILSLFHSQPKPQAPPGAHSPKWVEYRAHLALAHAQARRERCIGIVPAITERMDRER